MKAFSNSGQVWQGLCGSKLLYDGSFSLSRLPFSQGRFTARKQRALLYVCVNTYLKATASKIKSAGGKDRDITFWLCNQWGSQKERFIAQHENFFALQQFQVLHRTLETKHPSFIFTKEICQINQQPQAPTCSTTLFHSPWWYNSRGALLLRVSVSRYIKASRSKMRLHWWNASSSTTKLPVLPFSFGIRDLDNSCVRRETCKQRCGCIGG